MPAEMSDAIQSFIAIFANMKMEGALYASVMMIVCLAICLEGIKLYKIVLYLSAFSYGFRYAHDLLWARIPNDETLLMVEVAAGLICAVFAWKVHLLGIGMLVYQFAREYLKDRFDGPFAVVTCIAVSVVVALIAMKAFRAAIVVITAVIGGFAAVSFFQQLLPLFPADLSFFPSATSQIWTFAKIFLAAAGVGVQDPREPKA